MSKKLRKKIEEMCGLVELKPEARQEKAKAILASPDWKQKLCNELPGLSFKDIEKVLVAVSTERTFKTDDGKTYNVKAGSSMAKEVNGKSQRASVRQPPRTLEEILAQVYAPREFEGDCER